MVGGCDLELGERQHLPVVNAVRGRGTLTSAADGHLVESSWRAAVAVRILRAARQTIARSPSSITWSRSSTPETEGSPAPLSFGGESASPLQVDVVVASPGNDETMALVETSSAVLSKGVKPNG